ncbi:MAG: FadR/GntR family transcriptional regulator [Pseudomonadota bacterium]
MAVRSKPAAGSAPNNPTRLLRIHGKVARELGTAIVSGRYRPGDILHGEIDASDRLKVSRTAYREAIRILAAKGLVGSRPKVGTRVNPEAEWHLLDPDVLGWMFDVNPNESFLESLFELRKIIEPEAAALAAKRRTDKHLAAMADGLRGMATHTLYTEAGRNADRDFHAALLSASANAFLISLTSGVSAAISWTTVFKQRAMPKQRDPVPDHERVYDAISAGDANAARKAMADLVDMAFLDASKAHKPKRRRAGRS